jgi:hypothetical protein
VFGDGSACFWPTSQNLTLSPIYIPELRTGAGMHTQAGLPASFAGQSGNFGRMPCLSALDATMSLLFNSFEVRTQWSIAVPGSSLA